MAWWATSSLLILFGISVSCTDNICRGESCTTPPRSFFRKLNEPETPDEQGLVDVLEQFDDEEFVMDAKMRVGVKKLRSRFEKNGYKEKNIYHATGTSMWEDFPTDQFSNISNHAKYEMSLDLMVSNEGRDELYLPRHRRLILRTLIKLFLMGKHVSYSEVSKALKYVVITTLSRLKIFSFHYLTNGGSSHLLSIRSNGEPDIHSLPQNTEVYITSRVQISPISDASYVVTDFFQSSAPHIVSFLEPVMYIGGDSRALVWAAPRPFDFPLQTQEGQDDHMWHGYSYETPEKSTIEVLDLCTGSGVQAIAALASYARNAVLVDMNPRAVRFSRFNLFFNGMETRARVLLGDLYKVVDKYFSSESPGLWWDNRAERFVDLDHVPVPPSNHLTKIDGEEHEGGGTKLGGRGTSDQVNDTHNDTQEVKVAAASPKQFDVILGNPPYLPYPQDDGDPDSAAHVRFGDGGDSGELIFEQIVQGARAHLKPHTGRLHIVANLMNPREFEIKARRWFYGIGDAAEAEEVPASFHLIHGNLWTDAYYASMIPTSEAEQRREYLHHLQRQGIREAAAGFLFIYLKPPAWRASGEGTRASGLVEYVRHQPEEFVWQIVSSALHHDAEELREFIWGLHRPLPDEQQEEEEDVVEG